VTPARPAAAGYDPDSVAEVEELALRQAIETIGRVDSSVWPSPHHQKGTDIVVELLASSSPTSSASEHHRPHRPA